MTPRTDDTRMHDPAKHPLVVRVTDNDFQCEVLEKLARLEAKMETLLGSGQPGRMSVIEARVNTLERNDVRRGWDYGRGRTRFRNYDNSTGTEGENTAAE